MTNKSPVTLLCLLKERSCFQDWAAQWLVGFMRENAED